MRSLSEVTAAVRQGEEVTEDELRCAVVAYDVLIAQLDLPASAVQLMRYFQAADADLRDYIGEANDPDEPTAREWYAAMHRAGLPLE